MSAVQKTIGNKFIRTLIPLAELSESNIGQLSSHYKVEEYQPGELIFHKGGKDRRTIYVLSGRVVIKHNSGMEKKITGATTQARHALLPGIPRQADAIADTHVSLLSIDSEVLEEMLHSNRQSGFEVSNLNVKNNTDWMTQYLQSKVFLKLPAQNIQALMMRLDEIAVSEGQVIINQGDDDGYYYIVKKGHCRVSHRISPLDDGIELATLTVGSGFGEEAIITNSRRGATVTMINNGSLMRLSRNDFNRLLVDPLINEFSYTEAVQHVNHELIDVRSFDEYTKDGISGCTNIPLVDLRSNINTFSSKKLYIVCSDNGNRAAAAAFLLCQQGYQAVVLKYGLESVPFEVPRGNHDNSADEDNIPLVDNVVNLANINPTNQDSLPTPTDTDEAMQDPRVQSLFSHARNKLDDEALRASQAEQSHQIAQGEVQRLREETEQAHRELEQAKLQVRTAAQQSAQMARREATEEAALRELELESKQIELDEAISLADAGARRAQEAERARVEAQQEISHLRNQLDETLVQSQEEAKKSAELIRIFTEQHAENQVQAKRDSLHTLEVEQQLRQLKEESERTKSELQEQILLTTEKARQEKNRITEEARQRAESEIQHLKAETEKERLLVEQQAHYIAEQARQESEEAAKLRENTQSDLALAAQIAKDEAKRAQQAEQERAKAEQEMQRLKDKYEQALNETQQLSKSVIGKENKKNLQAAEKNREQAEQEIGRLKSELQVLQVNTSYVEEEPQVRSAQGSATNTVKKNSRIESVDSSTQSNSKAERLKTKNLTKVKEEFGRESHGMTKKQMDRPNNAMRPNAKRTVKKDSSGNNKKVVKLHDTDKCKISQDDRQADLDVSQYDNLVPMEEVLGISKENDSGESQWISDQVMWETTLGFREDEKVDEAIQPNELQNKRKPTVKKPNISEKSKQRTPVSHASAKPKVKPSMKQQVKPALNLKNDLGSTERFMDTGQFSDTGSFTNTGSFNADNFNVEKDFSATGRHQKAVFAARNVRPTASSNVTAPDLSTVRKRFRFSFGKSVVASIVCIAIAGAIYVGVMDAEKRTALKNDVNVYISKMSSFGKQKQASKSEKLGSSSSGSPSSGSSSSGTEKLNTKNKKARIKTYRSKSTATSTSRTENLETRFKQQRERTQQALSEKAYTSNLTEDEFGLDDNSLKGMVIDEQVYIDDDAASSENELVIEIGDTFSENAPQFEPESVTAISQNTNAEAPPNTSEEIEIDEFEEDEEIGDF